MAPAPGHFPDLYFSRPPGAFDSTRKLLRPGNRHPQPSDDPVMDNGSFDIFLLQRTVLVDLDRVVLLPELTRIAIPEQKG